MKIYKRLMVAMSIVMLMASCEEEVQMPQTSTGGEVLVARLAVKADGGSTRAYDESLAWSWETSDCIKGYQMAGDCIRNTLQFVTDNGGQFICEAFRYMQTDPAQFHFVYPAAAEVQGGELVAVQDGTWRPLSVTTTEVATIDALPALKFTPLSAALELRIYNTDKATPYVVNSAHLSSTADFVGKWTINDDGTYTQSLSGKDMRAGNLNSSIVTFNMPDMPSGYGEGVPLSLTLTDADGKSTAAITLPTDLTFVKGKRTVLNVIFVPQAGESGGGDEPEQGGTLTGTFTCATYNVDGLPSLINSNGPGSSGTKSISQKLATSGWDFMTFQEDFEYNDELVSSLSSIYQLGTYRGSVGVSTIFGKADTDGLNFAALSSTCSFAGETYIEFTDTYGGLTDGANTCIEKGFRYYLLTLANGVEIDVIVTHMNSGSDSGHISARESQLKQIAAYINSIKGNNRPIIFMGDTNCRYTRDDMFGCFFNLLDNCFTYADPWVEYSWAGVYPELGSASLMVPSKDSSSTLTEQTGEVVDKIIYLNNVNAETQIKADNYMNDTAFAGMADHNPVRATFTYTKTVK